MPTRSTEDSLRGLRDDRVVYARGERVEDVTEHPATRVSARHAAGACERPVAEDVGIDPEVGG